MFSFSIDAPRKLIQTVLEGFLSLDEVRQWSRGEQTAATSLRCGSRGFLLYVDISRCAIQSQEVVALFQQIVLESKLKARRIAIMHGNSLAKMQTRRIVAGTHYIAHFTDRTAAESWLFADEAPVVESRMSAIR